MKLTSEELVEEFYNLNKDKFPDITLEQAKDICYGPWRFLKKEMESGELSEVRFKYFGSFQVYPGRAKNMLENIKERFKFNKINKEEFFRIKTMLEKFINENKY
jgi:hypothetical protein